MSLHRSPNPADAPADPSAGFAAAELRDAVADGNDRAPRGAPLPPVTGGAEPQVDPTGHDTFYERLPDLLFEHGEPDLLGHLGSCALCRERMLLLGRIDRLLRRRRPGRQGLNRSACSAEERRA